MIDDDHESWSHPVIHDAGNYIGLHRQSAHLRYRSVENLAVNGFYYNLRGGAFK